MVQPVGTHAHFSLTFKRNAPLALAAFKLQTEVPVRCMWEWGVLEENETVCQGECVWSAAREETVVKQNAKGRTWSNTSCGVSTARVVYEASLAYGCKKQAYKTFSSLRQICLLRGVQSSLQNTVFWGTYLPTLKCVQNAAKMAASWAKATTRQARCSEKARGDFVLVTPAW